MAANTASDDLPRTSLATFDVLGVGVSVVTLESAVTALIDWAGDDCGRFVCIRDAHGVMLARKDAAFAQIHDDAAMVTPDGMPLALLGKLRGLPVKRTCGPDLMLQLAGASPKAGISHYFYGGRDGIAQELAEKMRAQFPGITIVGEETPPFRPISDAELRDLAVRIKTSGADIVWIGLSTPKQEHLMARLAPLGSATLIGVGAAFDVHSGHMERAPQWMQKVCLEGVYRFMMEPRRLWRRYLVLAPRFLALASAQYVKDKITGGDAGKTRYEP